MAALLSLLVAMVAGGSLLLSGVLKLGRSDQVLRGMRELRVPGRLVRQPIATAVPVIEIALGLTVIAGVGAWRTFAATIALAVHLTYLALVARAVRGNWMAHCHCFGSKGEGPVTSWTVARNAAFTVAAVGALAIPAEVPSGVGILVAVVLLAGALRLRLLPQPRDRDDLVLRNAKDQTLTLSEFHDPPTVLVFFSPQCRPCRSLVPYFRWWPNQLPPDLDLQPVFIGRPEEFAQIEEFAPLVDHAWFDPDKRVARALGVHASPAGVYISSKAPNGTGAVSSRPQIEQLLISYGAQVTPPAG